MTIASGSLVDAQAAPGPAWRGPLLDPGWLFLVAGVVLVASVVLIPAVNDLEEARFYRDRVLAAEAHRKDRLERYNEFLQALQRGEPDLVRSLAATQLNQTLATEALLMPPGVTIGDEMARRSASVFASLEPPTLVLPERPQREISRLERWATDQRSRLWLLGAGALLILVGLLPPSVRKP